MSRYSSGLYCAVLLINLLAGGLGESVPLAYSPVRLAYVVVEPSAGPDESLPPVIFLHGASALKEYWFDVPQIVADGTNRRVYNIDARNHGDSEWSEEYNFDMNAQDLLHFMDSKSIRKATLIGHSMGGITAIKVALSHPEKVEMAFIEDIYTKRVPIEILQVIVKYLGCMEEAVAQIPTDLDEAAAHAFVEDFLAIKEEEITGVKPPPSNWTWTYLKRGDDGRYALKGNLKALMAALRTEETMMAENKGVYEGRAYFIYGTESPFRVWDEVDHILQHFPNAKFFPIERVDHEVRLKAPEEFTNIVIKHINA